MIIEMLPIGLYDDDELVINKHDVNKLIKRIEDYEKRKTKH